MKRIALIVTGTALLVASCGIASAASKTEVTMPNHVIVPYPAELETKALMLAPNTAYQLLNPVSPEQQVAKAEARKHLTRPQYTLSPEQQVARAEHVTRPQYTVSPEQLVARAEHVARPLKHATKPTSPVIGSQAPTGFGGCPPDDRPCSGNGPLSPRVGRAVGRLGRKWKSGRRQPDQRPAVTARSSIASRLRAGRSLGRAGAEPFRGIPREAMLGTQSRFELRPAPALETRLRPKSSRHGGGLCVVSPNSHRWDSGRNPCSHAPSRALVNRWSTQAASSAVRSARRSPSLRTASFSCSSATPPSRSTAAISSA